MSESLKEMQDRHAILMAATDPKTGVRIYERDGKYQREVFALGVAIEDRKVAEAPGAQIAAHQLKQFEWLDRAQAARDKSGARMTEQNISGTTHSTEFAKNLDKARQSVIEGRLLTPEFISNTERNLAEQGATMPAAPTAAPVRDTTPVAPLAQPTLSFIKGSR